MKGRISRYRSINLSYRGYFYLCSYYLGLLIFALFFANQSFAHQPVLNIDSPNSKEEPYIIEKPEISKAIYSELKGSPHYFVINSDKPFNFYLGITQPKIDNCPISTKFSMEVLDSNFKVLEFVDGENFEWWEWYEEYGKKWYWIGPEIGEDFKSDREYNAGVYYIRVYNAENEGKYALTVGDVEKFTLPVIARTVLIMPKINSRFWEDSAC